VTVELLRGEGGWRQLEYSQHACMVAEYVVSSKGHGEERTRVWSVVQSKKEHHCPVAWSPIPFQATPSPPVLASSPANRATADPDTHFAQQPRTHFTLLSLCLSAALPPSCQTLLHDLSTQLSFAQTARPDLPLLWLVMRVHTTCKASSPFSQIRFMHFPCRLAR
jgi:hypothetical protein